MSAVENEVVWINGWKRCARGWALEVVARQVAGWETRLEPVESLLPLRRLFEPSARAFKRLPSSSSRLCIPDLSRLSPLLEAGQLVAPFIPPARDTRHAVFVVPQGERCLYMPAALLLQELWLWTAGAMEVLLTPNSLALYLRQFEASGRAHAEATGPLARVGDSDTSVRRLCWLAQCPDAQSSWSSVLTFAHQGALSLRLPRASIDAWAWGVEVDAGTLVTELSSVDLRFALPREDCQLLLGGAQRTCPMAPERKTGLVSF
jgi:hypothetical protein